MPRPRRQGPTYPDGAGYPPIAYYTRKGLRRRRNDVSRQKTSQRREPRNNPPSRPGLESAVYRALADSSDLDSSISSSPRAAAISRWPSGCMCMRRCCWRRRFRWGRRACTKFIMSYRRICESNPSGIISIGAHPHRVPALTGSKRTSCELRLQKRGAKDFAAANPIPQELQLAALKSGLPFSFSKRAFRVAAIRRLFASTTRTGFGTCSACGLGVGSLPEVCSPQVPATARVRDLAFGSAPDLSSIGFAHFQFLFVA
ncbi:hypothetical protein AMJ98_PE00577 (plasmid) [Rhizobium sp. N1341]|nr:hypothetical protein AMJ98_PE00577 [Rhizobium sp. N1341]ANM38472.1 hypothetical protein AMK04_PD00578 [Rhizobium sp. N871]ANM44626.1 hypothetical protein AMK03_PE00578 [Rhizobium sp. N741]